MKRYLILIEQTATGYSAYAPDVPGCVSTGVSRQEVERNMREALACHFELMREEGMPIPQNLTEPAFVEVAA